jgi:MFS family permease
VEQTDTREVAAPSETTHDTRGLWPSILGSGLARAGGAAILFMLQVYQSQLGVDPSLIGLVGVAFYLTELTCAPIFGTLVDRRGWKPFLLLGPVLSAISAVATWLVTFLSSAVIVPVLVIARLLNGVGIASNIPATLAFLSAVSGDDPKVRARAVGYFELSTIGGAAVGGLLGSFIWSTFGLVGFLVLAAFYMVGFFVYQQVPTRLAHIPVKEHTDQHPNPLHLLKIKPLWTFAPAWIVVNGVLGIWLNNFAAQLTLNCAQPGNPSVAELCSRFGTQYLVGDFSTRQAGIIFTAFAICFCIGIILWVQILPRLRQSNGMLIALVGSFVTCAVAFAINQYSGNQPILLFIEIGAVVIALMVLSGFTPAALGILVELAERNPQDRGSIMGAYSVLLGVGQFVGGLLGGIFASRLGVNGLILITLIFSVAAGVFVMIYRRTEPKGPPVTAHH